MFELKWRRSKDGVVTTRHRRIGAHIIPSEEGDYKWVFGSYSDKAFPWLLYSSYSGRASTVEEAKELLEDLIVDHFDG